MDFSAAVHFCSFICQAIASSRAVKKSLITEVDVWFPDALLKKNKSNFEMLHAALSWV